MMLCICVILVISNPTGQVASCRGGGICHAEPQPLPSVQINLKMSQHDCIYRVHAAVKCVHAPCVQTSDWSAHRREILAILTEVK